jgi:hypothetical protein
LAFFITLECGGKRSVTQLLIGYQFSVSSHNQSNQARTVRREPLNRESAVDASL